MTVNNNQSKYSYAGNGTTGPWNYPRYFIQDADLLVTKTDAFGTETTLLTPADYTVSGAGSPSGGFVTTTALVAGGDRITISGNVDLVQGDSYPETGLLPAKTVERGLDRLTMMVQQINEKISRAFKLKISSTVGEVIVDDPIEGNILAWISGRLGNVTGIAVGLLTAFFQNASNNVSVGRPGSVTAGHKFDVNGNLWVQNTANINTSGDLTGSDSINTYGQIDAYQPNSAMGAVGSVSVPGISPSSSRGTGTAPTRSLANDLLGGTSMYAYSGVSPAYNCHAGIFGRATGATANNLGGSLEFYTKADNGALTLAMGIDERQNLNGPLTPKINNFRLTLTTGVPVTTTNVTGASTVFLTPYNGNQIALYNGTTWELLTTAQVSLALSGLTSDTLYDVFAYNNAGVVTLETLAWANSGAGTSARATALTTQDGVLVRSGSTTRRYMGTFYSTGTTTTEDSAANRYLWNYYNRVNRPMLRTDGTVSWTYSTAAWRQANNNAANQLNFVIGVSEDAVSAGVSSAAINNTSTFRAVFFGVALDNITGSVFGLGGGQIQAALGLVRAFGSHSGIVAAGRHYFAWLEYGAGTDTQTWSGGVAFGINGSLMG